MEWRGGSLGFHKSAGVVCGARRGAGWPKAWAMVTTTTSAEVCSDFLQVGNLGVISPTGRRKRRTESIRPGFRGKERQGCGRGHPGLPQGPQTSSCRGSLELSSEGSYCSLSAGCSKLGGAGKPWAEMPFACSAVAAAGYLTLGPVFSKAGSVECFLPACGSMLPACCSMDCTEARGCGGDLTQERSSFFS